MVDKTQSRAALVTCMYTGCGTKPTYAFKLNPSFVYGTNKEKCLNNSSSVCAAHRQRV